MEQVAYKATMGDYTRGYITGYMWGYMRGYMRNYSNYRVIICNLNNYFVVKQHKKTIQLIHA